MGGGGGYDREVERRRADLVRVSMWVCTRCGYANWATRNKCNACLVGRAVDAHVVDQWWHRDRVPPEVAGTSARLAREPSRPPLVRRAPGLQPEQAAGPTGRVPTRFVEDKGEGERANREVTERAKTGTVGHGGADTRGIERREGRQTIEAKGKGQGEARRREGLEENSGGKEKQTKQEELPPARNFAPPAAPREILARQLQEEEDRAEALREEGATERKIQKADRRKQRIEEQLKLAGGKTPQSLGLQIRKEEENKRKALANMESCNVQIKAMEEEVLEVQKRIEEEKEKKERYRQRGEIAETRLAWLATQKAKESMPAPFMERLRVAARAVSGLDLQELGPVRELLSVLAAAPEAIDIAESDSSESSGRTEEIMGRSSWEPEEDLETFEERDRGEVQRARRKHRDLHRSYEEALELAFQQRSKAPKRGWDREPKEHDEVMEESEVPALDPEQTVQFYRRKVVESEKELTRLERGAKKEVVLVLQRPKSEGGEKAGRWGPGVASGSRDKGHEEGEMQVQHMQLEKGTSQSRRDEAGLQLARGEKAKMEVDVPKQQKEERREDTALEREVQEGRYQMETNMEIMLQERMQEQQEQELAMVAKLAVVRKQAEEIEKRRARPY